jgi:hypothetical protein
MTLVSFKTEHDPLEWGTSFDAHGLTGSVLGGFEGTFPHALRIPLMGAIQSAFVTVAARYPEAVMAAMHTEIERLAELITAEVDLAEYGADGRVTITCVVPKEEPKEEPKPARAAVDPIDETAIGGIQAIDPVLPFEPGPAAPRPRRPKSDLPEALPFASLTLEQYASLCVERTLAPDNEAIIALRYGVRSVQSLAKLEATWKRRLDADADLRQRFERAKSQYQEWLRKRK